MRIISDFKDYYDGLARYDPDHDTLFVRTRSEHELDHRFPMLDSSLVVSFCGRFYPAWVGRREEDAAREVIVYDKESIQFNMRWFKHSLEDFFAYWTDGSQAASWLRPMGRSLWSTSTACALRLKIAGPPSWSRTSV
jgi:hypothetical protein